MTCSVSLNGNLSMGGDCGCSSGGGSNRSLSLACGSRSYAAAVATECPVQISTPGVIGAAWVELPTTETLGQILFLSVKGNSPYRLRVGADVARLAGSGGTFPTSFAGGETFAFTVDAVAVPVVFTSAAQSAAQVAKEINQAAIAAGLTYLPCSVATSGQLELHGSATGEQGSIAITTARAAIGFASVTTVKGAGRDETYSGIFLAEFESVDAPTRVQISGNSRVEVFAAGTAV